MRDSSAPRGDRCTTSHVTIMTILIQQCFISTSGWFLDILYHGPHMRAVTECALSDGELLVEQSDRGHCAIDFLSRAPAVVALGLFVAINIGCDLICFLSSFPYFEIEPLAV